MKFTKMHGTGNDYIYVNGFEEKLENPSDAAVKLSDRRFGIGSDGLILILPSDVADCRMEMFNADGSIGKMCGNGIRCVAKYVWQRINESINRTVDEIRLDQLIEESRKMKDEAGTVGACCIN